VVVKSNALCVGVLILPESCVFLAAAKFALIREKLAFAPHSNPVIACFNELLAYNNR